MIAGLIGTLDSLGEDWALINVQGVLYQVFVPTSTIAQLGTAGSDVRLHTYLHVKDDGLVLYGFATTEELSFFKLLITVSGLGPRLALAVLSSMNTEQGCAAIAGGNADFLVSVPGIGKKMANRIVLELKEKVGDIMVSTISISTSPADADFIAALTSLGYSVAEANRALTAIPDSSSLNLEDKIKQALAWFVSQ